MGIGDNIKSARLERGLTQVQLAERCEPKIADSAIRKYESGKVTPKVEMIKRIATALELEDYELVYYSSNKQIEPLVEHFITTVSPAMSKAAELDQAKYGKDTLEKSYLMKRTDVYVATSNAIDNLSAELDTILKDEST